MKKLEIKTKYCNYFVDKNGNIISECLLDKKKIKKIKVQTKNIKRGYMYVKIGKKNLQVHRLVAKAFVKNPYNKPCVNHKDFNKANNQASNLEWVTHKENTAHNIKNNNVNLFKKNQGANLKYSIDTCKKVACLVKNGMTYAEAGKMFSMPYSTVAHLLRGSRRKL